MQKKLRKFFNQHQKLKKFVKFIILNTFSIFGFTANLATGKSVKVSKLPGNSFFGYYDKNPQTKTGVIVVHHLVDNDDCEIEIWLLDKDLEPIKLLTKSKAWNFQQGSRTHWISECSIILNDIVNDKIISKVVDIKTGKIKFFDHPVHDSFPKKNVFVTTDFIRTTLLQSEYGYVRASKGNEETYADKNNLGIGLVDVISGNLLVKRSMSEIAFLMNKKNYNNALINHVMVSPSGTKLMFIYREFIHNQRFDNLLVCNLDLSEMKVILSETMVSHMVWLTDNEIFGYLEAENYEGYHHLKLDDLKSEPIYALSPFFDGHPTLCSDGILCFDTYPNVFGLVKLFEYGLGPSADSQPKLIYRNFHPPKFRNENRCDLHPRYSSISNRIFIDTIIKGKRKFASI